MKKTLLYVPNKVLKSEELNVYHFPIILFYLCKFFAKYINTNVLDTDSITSQGIC